MRLALAQINTVVGDLDGNRSLILARLEEAYASRARYGAPAWAVDGWVSSYRAIAVGELDVVSDVVEQVAGHSATDFADFVHTLRR